MRTSELQDLAPEQLELLGAASRNRGQMTIALRSDTHGRAVRTKKERFCDPDDPSVAARYIQAVSELKHLELVRQAGRSGNYELTNAGWLLSRKIQSA